MGGPGEHESLAEQTVGDYLGRLASRTSMPAGGVVCAVEAAQAAALVAMAARFSAAEDDAAVSGLAESADRLRDDALRLADEDQRAYADVSAAYSLPRQDPERGNLLASALVKASHPPAGVVAVADQVLALAEQLVPVVNRTLWSDLAVAADVAHAAASGARLTLEANLRGIVSGDERDRIVASLELVDQTLPRAVAVRESLRQKSPDEPVHTS